MILFTGVSIALNVVIHTTGLVTGTPCAGPYPGIYCSVYVAGTAALAPIYSNPVTRIENPFLVNADGTFRFFGPEASYDLIFTTSIPAKHSVPTVQVPSYQTLPPPTSLMDGSLALVTTGTRGLWLSSGSAWQPVNDAVQATAFGATGDGVTDDTAAIQAAIDSLPADLPNDDYLPLAGKPARGGTVILGQGVYHITSLHLGSFHRLKGQGKGSTVLHQTTTTGPAITVGTGFPDYCYQVAIEDLTLEGSASGFVSGNYGIHHQLGLRCLYEGLLIGGFGDAGFYGHGGAYTYLQDSVIVQNQGHGVLVASDGSGGGAGWWATDFYLLRNTIRLNADAGVRIVGNVNGARLAFCTLESNGSRGTRVGLVGSQSPNVYNLNLHLDGTTNVTVTHNYFEQSSAWTDTVAEIALSDGYSNTLSHNYLGNFTPLVIWRSNGGAGSYNTVAFNEGPNDPAAPCRELYDGPTPPVGNKFLFNTNLSVVSQSPTFQVRSLIANYLDKGVRTAQVIAGGADLMPDCGLRDTNPGGTADVLGTPKGNVFLVTLDQPLTVHLPQSVLDGEEITFEFVQDAVGGRNVSWDAQYKTAWTNTGNTATKRSSIRFYWASPYWRQIGAQALWY